MRSDRRSYHSGRCAFKGGRAPFDEERLLNLDLHYLPGFFSEGVPRLLERLSQGVGPVTVSELRVAGEASKGTAEMFRWLGETPDGGRRAAMARVAFGPGEPIDARMQVVATPPSGRLLFGMQLVLPPERGLAAMRQLEMGFLSIACAALAAEAQGAVLVGTELEPVGEGVPRGTVAEAVTTCLTRDGAALGLVICTADTAASLGTPEGFTRGEIGDLVELRRG